MSMQSEEPETNDFSDADVEEAIALSGAMNEAVGALLAKRGLTAEEAVVPDDVMALAIVMLTLAWIGQNPCAHCKERLAGWIYETTLEKFDEQTDGQGNLH